MPNNSTRLPTKWQKTGASRWQTGLLRLLLFCCGCASAGSGAQRDILTPPPPAKPVINGPAVYGVRPGHPFLYLVPTTGERPIQFSAAALPRGLSLDPVTGIITGTIARAGEYAVRLSASNAHGKATRAFKIIVGSTLALTPPMGWSSWYMAYANISDELIRAQADALISSGLVQHGYSFVDIDDGWNIKVSGADAAGAGTARTAAGDLMPNAKFPDMKALTSYVHGKGLKTGIYTSPGPSTCGGYEGSYRHEKQDAQLFSSWGFDLVKYDLCSYRKILSDSKNPEDIEKPYQLMGDILKAQDRDMLFNLCEYGRGDVWTWARKAGGHFWRTTGDVGGGGPNRNLWVNMSSMGFGQAGKEKWAGPGGWNDPDNILIGQIYWNGQLAPTPLTHNEQYTYVTLWSVLSSPLVFGGDMTKLDDFTLSLLTNDEIIAVNQDPLGRQGAPVLRSADSEIWVKDLLDGSKAVGLFNRSNTEAQISVRWSDLGISGAWMVRDLWRQKNLGSQTESFQMPVGEHGAEMILLLRKPRKTVAASSTPRQELASSYTVSRRASAPFALQRKR